MSTLRTINQIMGIASKVHYLTGGNASKVLAKDKKGIFTIEQVAETLQCDPVELKALLQQQGIMCGDYVINEVWGDGEKLSTFALRTLCNKTQQLPKFLGFKKPQQQNMSNTRANIIALCVLVLILLFIFGYPLIGIVDLFIIIGLVLDPACKQFKEKHSELARNKYVVVTFNILKVVGYIFALGLGGMLIGTQLGCIPVTFVIWLLGIVIPIIRHYKKIH